MHQALNTGWIQIPQIERRPDNTERLQYIITTTRGQCSTPICPPQAGLPDQKHSFFAFTLDSDRRADHEKSYPPSLPPFHPPEASGAGLGRKKATGVGLARTQHPNTQHEGIHSVGHDPRPAPGRARRGHHLLWLGFLAFHLQ